MEQAKEICPTTTRNKIAEGAVLIDVREKDEVAALSYDVPQLMHIPLSEFEDRYEEVPKDKEVVMACRSGARSLKATYFLMNHGWTNVSNMEHGIIRWAQKDFPTKGDKNAVLENNQDGGCCGTTSCC